jgi:F-type H+-transporting ATPase subunit alpha
MRQVAGRLRLELAQYRELEAFAKFGSDLDKSTQQQLNRGARLVELLKQGQYSPVPVEEQVVVLFAGTNGYIDSIPVPQVRRYESELLDFIRLRHQDVLTAIVTKKVLDEELTNTLKSILGTFTENFVRG